MSWYLIQTKPRLESVALESLSNQRYECYLPMLRAEKLIKSKVEVVKVPLFPRYLFIKLGLNFSSMSWGPIRSTRGVSQLVKFGSTPAKVPTELINLMLAREIEDTSKIRPLYKPGQSVKILSGPFLGFESVYRGMDPQMRVIVLLDLMNKSFEVKLEAWQINSIN